MDNTPNLNLPYIQAAQAQKHVTHNEAIRALDALLHLSVVSRSQISPPVTPQDGERYLIPNDSNGDWVNRGGEIAAYQDGAWEYFAPKEGWIAWIEDENALYAYDGSDWVQAGGEGGSVNPAALVGVNTLADSTNKLAVKSDTVLFSHDDVTPGNGDIRVNLNKSSAASTASLLMQDDWSGRAEIGLAGDDDLHVKMSPDGANWNESLLVAKSNGEVAFPSGVKHHAVGKRPEVFFGIEGASPNLFRINGAHDANPRTAVLAARSGSTLTLTTNTAHLLFAEAFMGASVMVRIWNTTKSPDENAWVFAQPAANQLTVLDANSISTWSAGDTIQVGEVAPGGTDNVIAFDVSPMMTTLFGTPFRQTGITAKVCVSGVQSLLSATQSTTIGISPSGLSGEYAYASSLTHGVAGRATLQNTCRVQSPVSNSNLVFLRQICPVANAVSTSLINVTGFFVPL